jgi:hypothetical protein
VRLLLWVRVQLMAKAARQVLLIMMVRVVVVVGLLSRPCLAMASWR